MKKEVINYYIVLYIPSLDLFYSYNLHSNFKEIFCFLQEQYTRNKRQIIYNESVFVNLE